MREVITRNSDGSTVDISEQEAEQADTTARAKRIIQVNSSGSVIKTQRLRENLAGSSGTGSDGDANRIFTLTTSNNVDIVEVFLDGVLLVEASQYQINNSLKQATILINVWNSQTISIFYNI